MYLALIIFQKQNLKRFIIKIEMMKRIYFIIVPLTTLTIGILSINSVGITFAQEKNETAEIENSPLITTPELEESMETNNTSSQVDNNTSMIEKIIPK
jgi:hypothetical protein